MAVRKSGLGKGLDTLIPENIIKPEKKSMGQHSEIKVKITKVEPNKNQPRKKFDEDGLLELAESIKQFGILQPIIVQEREDYFQIIAGERRWRAAKLAGLKEVPIIIKKYSDQEIVEISLIENIQRENLNPIEEAKAYKRLLNEFNLKQDEVAERVSKSRTAVTNSMRLLKLDDRIQNMVIEEMLTSGHARTLLSLNDPKIQYTVAMKIFDEKLSVRDTEKLIKKINNENEKKKEDKTEVRNDSLDYIYKDLAEKIKSVIGTKVNVTPKTKSKGKIEIEYYSHEDLDRIMELLLSIKM